MMLKNFISIILKNYNILLYRCSFYRMFLKCLKVDGFRVDYSDRLIFL